MQPRLESTGKKPAPAGRLGLRTSTLRAYTMDAAYAEFSEREKGSLEVGKLADLVLLDRDITRVPAETIRDTRVLLTVVGGRVVYEAAP